MSTGVDEAGDLRRHEMRSAVTASRIGAPGGEALLVEVLQRQAHHYAGFVLGLPAAMAGVVADAAVGRTVKGLPKRLDVEEIEERLALAVRTEAFARQPGSGGRGRVLAAAALVVVVLGFGAFALSLGGDDPGGDDGPANVALAAETVDREVVLEGQVVVAGEPAGGTDLTDVAVQVRLDEQPIATARTDADGRFRMGGLSADVYDVRVAAPDGLRLADGSETIDLTDRGGDAVVLQLERP